MNPSRPLPDVSDLLSHGTWLRQLVAPLLGGEAAIDDVLQEVWLAALERPPQNASRLRGWLARVAWKRAQRHRRDAGRRMARDSRAAKPELIPAADRVAAEVELQAKLASLVLALELPYRRAILLRFYEGLPPRAIAAELGAPVATVKTWLRRGLEQLRGALSAEIGTDWRGALAPLALPSVIATPAAFGGAALVSLSLFGVAMQAKVVAALVVASVLGAWLWLAREEAAPVASPTAAMRAGEETRSSRSEDETQKEDDAIVVREGAASLASTSLPHAPPARELLVEVVDDLGELQRDIPVILKLWQREAPQSTLHGFEQGRFGVAEGASDARIHIPFESIEQVLERARVLREQGTEGVAVWLEAELGLLESPHVVLDGAPSTTSPMRLQIAASGGVRVEIVDGAGEKLQVPLDVRLRCISNQAFLPKEHEWRFVKSSSVRASGGGAEFARVPLGTNLRVEVRDPRPLLAARAIVAAGPTFRGEQIAIRVQLAMTAPVLAGRLVDAEDKPIAEQTFGFTAREGDRIRGAAVTTDAQGRFELPWDSDLDGARPTDTFLIQRTKRGIPDEQAESARIPAPAIGDTGRVELGTIVMRRPAGERLLAAGIVVDGVDQPVAGAHLSFFAIWPVSKEGPFEEHRHLQSAYVQSDADGRFRVVSAEPCRGLRVDARWNAYYLERSLLCEVGREDLKLVLRRGANLSGNLLLDPEGPRERISIEFVDPRPRILATDKPNESGAFVLRALRPARGAVLVKLDQLPLLRLEDFEIAGEGELSDPRLQDIDLRGRFREFRARVLHAGGGKLTECIARLGAVERQEGTLDLPLDLTGRGRIWIPREFEVVMLGATGYAAVKVPCSAEEQTVLLDRKYGLTLEVDPELELPPEHHLRVALRVPEGQGFTPLEQLLAYSHPEDLLPGAPVRRGLPCTGRFEVHIWIRSKLADREEYAGVNVIEIGEEARETLLRVAPNAEDSVRALQKLR